MSSWVARPLNKAWSSWLISMLLCLAAGSLLRAWRMRPDLSMWETALSLSIAICISELRSRVARAWVFCSRMSSSFEILL